MLSKSLLLALLAACGVHSNPATEPDPPNDVEPPDADEPVEDQYFCCQSVKFDGKEKTGHGDGCSMTDEKHVILCNTVLYCPGGYTMNQGAVDCPL
jgi:hypothetical protein